MRAYFKLAVIVSWTGICLAVVVLLRVCRLRGAREAVVRLCYRGLARIIGLAVRVEGAPAPTRPLLLLSNHIGYLDIVGLGAVAPLRFTPKAEVAGWPVIGFICRMTDCVFIDRRQTRAAENLRKLNKALQEERPVLLFPEGTTSDGKRVLPFRSSYFRLAEAAGETLAVQPVTLAYTHINGLPITSADFPRIAWYGDMDLAPHAKELLALGSIALRIVFHRVQTYQAAESRKDFSRRCEQIVAGGMQVSGSELA